VIDSDQSIDVFFLQIGENKNLLCKPWAKPFPGSDAFPSGNALTF